MRWHDPTAFLRSESSDAMQYKTKHPSSIYLLATVTTLTINEAFRYCKEKMTEAD
jgi:hypothetical protein